MNFSEGLDIVFKLASILALLLGGLSAVGMFLLRSVVHEWREKAVEMDEVSRGLNAVRRDVSAILASAEQRDRRFDHVEQQLDRLIDFHLKGG